MKFISISGKARSGKGTVAEHINRHFARKGLTINEFSFAGPFKDALCLWFGWDRDRLNWDTAYKEGDTLDDGIPDPYCAALGMTRRTIMQKFGTECMREGMHPDFWVILADLALQRGLIPHSDIYLISDARFLNELRWTKKLGGYQIHIIRETTMMGDSGHVSETEFLQWNDYTYVVANNRSLGALEWRIRKMLIPNIERTLGL